RRTPDTIVSPKKNQRSVLAASVTSSSSRMRTSFRSSFRWNATVTGCTRSNPSTLAIWMKTIQRYMPSSRLRADGAATPSAHFPRGLHADFRQVRERLAHPVGRVLVVLELAVHVPLVSTEVEVAVARKVEGDDLRLARLFASESLVDHDTDRVRRFRCGQVALGSTAMTRRSFVLPVSLSATNGNAKPLKFEPPPTQPTRMSGCSSASSSCFFTS